MWLQTRSATPQTLSPKAWRNSWFAFFSRSLCMYQLHAARVGVHRVSVSFTPIRVRRRGNAPDHHAPSAGFCVGDLSRACTRDGHTPSLCTHLCLADGTVLFNEAVSARACGVEDD